MVTKKKSTKGRVKVGKLKLKKETVKDLGRGEAGKIKGGYIGTAANCQDCGPATRGGVSPTLGTTCHGCVPATLS